MTTNFRRDAVSRARQFIELARNCSIDQRDQHEMFIEAAIIFGRTAIHRLKPLFKTESDWKAFLRGLSHDPSIEFFRVERDYVLKEGPTKVGQVIRPGSSSHRAEEFYYFDDPDTPATRTIEHHLSRIETIVDETNAGSGQS
jgi:hypothetical protein